MILFFSQMWTLPMCGVQDNGGELPARHEGSGHPARRQGGRHHGELSRVLYLLVQDPADQVSAAQLFVRQQEQEAAPLAGQVEGIECGT